MKLSFVLAESALELVPKEVRSAPDVVSDARRRGAEASEILLDGSFHQSAMLRLKEAEKRGRPDLVHVSLLAVTGTPLYLDGGVKVFVHTYDDKVLELAEETRIPKNYLRFRGLAEQVLSEGKGTDLVKLRNGGIKEVVGEAAPDMVCGLSVQGKMTKLTDLAGRLAAARQPCVLVGGFPHGHFSKETLQEVEELVRVDPRPLEAHVVAGRLVYELERALGRFND